MKKNSKWMCVILITIFIIGGVLWSAVSASDIDYSQIRVRISLHEASIPVTLNEDYYLMQKPNIILKKGSYTLSIVDKEHVRIRGGEVDEKFKNTLTIVPLADKGTVRLKGDAHGTVNYLGKMEFRIESGKLRAVNHIDLERYLYGVVPYEMSNSWPLDALKAQAISARGYAAIRVAHRQNNSSVYFDVVDTVSHQVYKGYNPSFTNAIKAVNETAGEVLTYNGKMIDTYYAASNGGFTELVGNAWGGGDAKNKEFPYLVFKEDPYDLENPASLYQRFFVPKVISESDGLVDGQEIVRVTTTTDNLNVRSGPGTNFTVIGQAPPGSIHPYLGTEGGWYKISFEGKEGYVSSNFSVKETANLDKRYQYSSPVLSEMQELAYNQLVKGGKSIASKHDVRLLEVRSFENGTKRWPGTVTESYVTANATVRIRYHENDSNTASSAMNLNLILEIMRKSNGSYVTSHPYLDSRLRLRRVEQTDGGYFLTNGRFGHGIGMSQRGAEQMTRVHGKDYRYILAFYYKDTEISKIGTETGTQPRLTSNKYSITPEGITGVDTGLSIKAFKDHLTASGGTLQILGADGKEKKTGTIVTGDRAEVVSSTDSKIKVSYPVIIYGDVSGNGTIALRDLLLIQRHILGISALDGPYALAADVEKSGSIRLRDLLMVQRHILEIQKITQ